MASSHTTNINLNKPDRQDFVSVVSDINDNMDMIDAAIGDPSSASSVQGSDAFSKIGALNNIVGDVRNYGEVYYCGSLDDLKSALTSLITSMGDGTKKLAYIRPTATFGLFTSGITYLVDLSKYSQNYSTANIQQLAGPAFIIGMYAGSWAFIDLVTSSRLNSYIYAVNAVIDLGNIAANNYKDGYVDIDTPSGYSHILLVPQYTSVGMPIAGTYVSSGAASGKTRITAGVNNTKSQALSGVTATIRAVFYN